MNPSKKGWLQKYLQQRGQLSSLQEKGNSEHTEKQLYQVLQPTGIMYGHPLQHPLDAQLDLDHCDAAGLMKLILTESFLFVVSQNGLGPSKGPKTNSKIGQDLNQYYLSLYPKLNNTLKQPGADPLLLTERIINRRLKIQSVDIKSYLTTFFHNSLLFLDVLYYNRWIKNRGEIDLSIIKKEKQEVRFAVLKVMAAAAQADKKLQKEEKALFRYFMESADLTKSQEREAGKLLRQPPAIEDLKLPEIDSWILRKYLLEMAILINWADKEMTNVEKDFLNRLSLKLRFSKEELENSLLAVEGFILENYTDIRYLLGKQEFNIIRKRYLRHLKGFVNKNKEYVIQEVQESKELVILMNKSRTKPLTPDEKAKVRQQLIDILKTVPTFVIIALPFTFITLPILLSLLPKSAFPSAFQE